MAFKNFICNNFIFFQKKTQKMSTNREYTPPEIEVGKKLKV
jgi:hypothetical protein